MAHVPFSSGVPHCHETMKCLKAVLETVSKAESCEDAAPGVVDKVDFVPFPSHLHAGTGAV